MNIVWLGKQTSVIRTKTAKLTDNRLKMMNEILVGIHIIKMYAWEKPITKLMKTLRRFVFLYYCYPQKISSLVTKFVDWAFFDRLFSILSNYSFCYYTVLPKKHSDCFQLFILIELQQDVGLKRIYHLKLTFENKS